MSSLSKTRENDDKVTRGQWLALAGLAVSAFIFNTSEFIPIGLLSDIGQTFSLTEAQTGIMISVYAWGVMLFSLPLMVFASRFDFRRLLLDSSPSLPRASSSRRFRPPTCFSFARDWLLLRRTRSSGPS